MQRFLAFSIFMALAMAAIPLQAQRRGEPVEVRVDDLQPTPFGVSVTLRAPGPDQELHLMIGVNEGEAIARALGNQKPPRPMTHDLIKMILDLSGWRVQKVLIRALSGDTFLADLDLAKGGETKVLDVRPSDAMAIAVRSSAKIFVNPEVFEAERQRNQPQEVTPSQRQDLRL
jgi:uncharacterized protein